MLSIISWLFWTFLKLIGLYLALIGIRELYAFGYYSYYRKQGMKGFYFPILGFNILMMKKKDKIEQYDGMVEFVQKQYDENVDAVVCNSNKIAKSLVIIFDPKLMREYFAKEIEYTRKRPLLFNVNFGFFWDYGKLAMKKRLAFGEFFKISNLNKMAPMLLKIVNDHFENFIKENWKEGANRDEFIKVNIKEELGKIFDKTVTHLLFGEEELTLIEGGIALPTAMSMYINTSLTDVLTPLNFLTFDILANLGLTQGAVKGKQLYKGIKKAVMKVYKNRLESGPKKGTVNLLDLMIENNSKEGEIPWTEDEIVGNAILLQFAGVDTSKETSTSFIHHVVGKLKMQEEILECVQKNIFNIPDEEIDFDKLNSSEEFNCYADESLRLFPPFYFTNTRTVVRPMKLGKYDILPGTALFLMAGTTHMIDKFHKNPKEFNKERFTQKNRKKMEKMSYLPFSTGKRGCIGQYLGELMVKLMMSTLVKHFVIEKVDGYNPKRVGMMTYCYLDCWVRVKPRTK